MQQVNQPLPCTVSYQRNQNDENFDLYVEANNDKEQFNNQGKEIQTNENVYANFVNEQAYQRNQNDEDFNPYVCANNDKEQFSGEKKSRCYACSASFAALLIGITTSGLALGLFVSGNSNYKQEIEQLNNKIVQKNVLLNDLLNETNLMKNQLFNITNELKTLLIPASCRLSSVYGRQTLRTGEEAFCEDGWTVFQRRFNRDVDFHQNWTEYKQGFGDLNGDFWLGLDKIHNLTNDRGCKLRIDIWRTGDVHSYATYSDFYVEDESDNYRLQVNGYNGTAGDQLSYHNNMQFTTKDRDNDQWSGNCALSYPGGWWYKACYGSTLNISPMYWAGNVEKATMKVRCD